MNTTDFDIEIIEKEAAEEDIEIVDTTGQDSSVNVMATEDDVGNSTVVINEEDAYEPVVEYGEWQTPEDFQGYIVASLRNAPPIYEGSKNSLRRAFQHFKTIQSELIEGVEQDAPYADLNEDHLRTLDSLEEGIETALEQIAYTIDTGLTKTATKSSQFAYYVNPFVYGLARVIVNAKVSQGKNMEDVFAHLNDKYKISDREELELKFLLNDMGHPIRSSFVDGSDMMENYFA